VSARMTGAAGSAAQAASFRVSLNECASGLETAGMRSDGRERPFDEPNEVSDGELTAREHEIVALICAGWSTKEVAGGLAISWHTVRCHVRNAMKKMGVRTRIEMSALWHDEEHDALRVRRLTHLSDGTSEVDRLA
jgi:DNA-binding NarL/FixJ family response regulator